MAVTMADITKLRKMSGAGMMDCKKALTETDGDIEKAMEIIRKKGQAIAAKRSDRDARLLHWRRCVPEPRKEAACPKEPHMV